MNDQQQDLAAMAGGVLLIAGVAVGVGVLIRWAGLGVFGTAAVVLAVAGIGLLAASGWGEQA
jgi:hypothetical protein